MINESIATEEHMRTIFIGLQDVEIDYSRCTPINGSNPCIGIQHTEERKARISAALKGIKRTEEFKQKISETLKGHPVAPETKHKMSVAAKSRPLVSCVCCHKVVQGYNNLNLHYRFNHLGI